MKASRGVHIIIAVDFETTNFSCFKGAYIAFTVVCSFLNRHTKVFNIWMTLFAHFIKEYRIIWLEYVELQMNILLIVLF